MQAGYVISGAAHAGLIGWLLFGSFAIPPEPAVEVTSVALVSNEEYAAIIAAQEPPGATTEVEAPEAPEEPEAAAPEISDTQDTRPEQAEPEVSEAAEQDPVPEQPDPTPPAPEEVADEAPVIEQPAEDIAALQPEPQPEPAPRDVPRVAPQPVARPEPDVKVDEQVRQPAEQAEEAEEQREEQEATAPEEATTEIVTEPEKPKSLAPTVSKRPKPRPEVRQAAVEPEPKPEPEPEAKPAPEQTPEQTATPDPKPEAPKQDDKDAVAAALEKALGGGETENPAPSGPPLSAGEKDALRVAVSSCWNTGSLSSDALRVTVIVSVSMQEDGRPNANSISLVSSTGGSDSAARQAFEAARRAIIRCGSSGYDLPREKYGQWRDIEMTFNPEKMRIK